MEKIDLHLHTTYSDGDLDITTLLLEAKKRGIKTLAITDHETIIGLNGYKKAIEKYGIKIIPAIEMNVTLSGTHILGYGIEDLNKVEKAFDDIRIENENVVYDIIKYLKEDGVKIDESDVTQNTMEYHQNKKNIVEINNDIFKYQKEFVIAKNDVARTMRDLKIVESVNEAYNLYLNRDGKKYCIKTKKIDVRDAIELIDSCGGTTSLAHPMTVRTKKKSLINICKELKSYGLSGIEVDGNRFSNKQRIQYRNIAESLNLIETIGSDFHRLDQEMGMFVSNKIVDNLEQKIKEMKLIKHL